jgi:hypothetical protein
MRDNLMSPTQKIAKILIALLLAVFVTFLAWVVLRGQTNTSQLPSAPTGFPYADFAVHIPQKALLRNYVTVSVEATPGTNCKLTYIPPSGEIHQMDTIANTRGLCEWRWKVEESQGKGAGRLIFTIDGASDTHFMEILSGF